MLAISGLDVRRGERLVVEGVDLTVGAGEVVALLGPNGAGKSTVLKAALGLLPYGGSVRIAGAEVAGLDARERARRVGYVPQRGQLTAAMDVRNVVAQGRFAHQGLLARMAAADAAAVDAALARVDAVALAARPFTALSVGEQQRVLLARALAGGAPLLLLDEPTAALDIGHALALLALVRELARGGRAVVVVLHDLEQAARVADRVVLLDRGRVVAGGVPDAVLDGPHLAAVFGVTAVAGGARGFALASGPATEGTP